jgi:putative sigma-54 modulation protein
MKLKIQSLHFTAKEPLNEYVTKKVSKLGHFYNRIDAADVCLKLEKSDNRDNKVCEIRLEIPGNDLFAKRQSDTFEKAVGETVEALEQQVKNIPR